MDRQDEPRGHESPASEREKARRHVALWLSVGVSMAVIAVLWVVVLPAQLDTYAGGGMKSLFQSSPAATLSPDAEWRETMKTAADGLERASAGLTGEMAPRPQPSVTLDPASLAARLEAASPPAEISPDAETAGDKPEDSTAPSASATPPETDRP